MQYKAIFFDLDGTLLPLEQSTFSRTYFGGLAKVLAPFGIGPEQAVAAVKTGLLQMQKNTGEQLNETVFWQAFSEVLGRPCDDCRNNCDTYYTTGFHDLRACTRENPQAKTVVELARKAAGKVVLATNPVFPMVAQTTRLSWLGLTQTDFDHITCYSNAHYCKPNPQYYLEICRLLGVEPRECLMVGNDELEDMHGASAAGLHCLLLTDCLLPSAAHPWSGERCTFAQFAEKLQKGLL